MGYDASFMLMAIDLAKSGVENNDGGPFGCVIVKKGEIVGKGNNRVLRSNDPTAHAEITAIRDACTKLNSFQLDGCDIYTSCEPCPMCLGAIYWARPENIYFACSRNDAANIGFDDEMIYREINLPITGRKIPTYQHGRMEGLEAFELWESKEDKTEY